MDAYDSSDLGLGAARRVEAVPRLPAVVEAPADDVGLGRWVRGRRPDIERWLETSGAVLFRGFGVDVNAFSAVATELAGPALAYLERSTPRRHVHAGVYTSTEYPADQEIPLHNENAYQASPPDRIAFCCLVPAKYGGATTLADCRVVLERIDPVVVAEFARRGVGYLRNYGPGLGPSWQESFQTDVRGEVENYCRERGITMSWQGVDGLRTWQVRPALATHPRTGEQTWFNHAALFHHSRLPPPVAEALLHQCGGENGLPMHARFGDGGSIPGDVLEDVRNAYRAASTPLRWRAGDVAVLDNVLVAHGREAFRGERQVVVHLAGMPSAGQPTDVT